MFRSRTEIMVFHHEIAGGWKDRGMGIPYLTVAETADIVVKEGRKIAL